MKSIFSHVVLILTLLLGTAIADEYFHEDFSDSNDFESNSLTEFLNASRNGQIAMRLNEQGWLKILEMAMKYTAPGNAATFAVPANIYNFKLSKAQLLSNPIVPIIDEITNLGLREGKKKEVDFYFETSQINITGEVNKSSLKTEFKNSHANGFDLSVALDLPKVVVSAPNLSLCMDKVKGQCSKALKITIKNLKISTRTNPIKLRATLRVLNKNNIARIQLLSMSTNLEGKGAPTLEIDPRFQLIMPRLALEINGVETEIDTSKWKNELLKQRAFLARELMSFVADFAGKNLENMVNVYLVNTQVPTSWQLLNLDNTKPFNELKFEDQFKLPSHTDSTYVMPRLDENRTDYMKLLMDEVNTVIQKADAKIRLTSISNPSNKDIELHAALNMILNNQHFLVSNTIHNSDASRRAIPAPAQTYDPSRVARDNTYVYLPPVMIAANPVFLPDLNLAPYRNNDITLAISEPLINGTLDIIQSTGLLAKIVKAVAKENPELSLQTKRGLRVHFSKDRKITLVANVHVDMTKLKGPKNTVGRIIEWFNNTTQLKFPLEIEIIPSLKKNSSGEVVLALYVKSPFTEKGVRNTFGYHSDVPDMTNIVRSGLLEKFKEALGDFVNKEHQIVLTQYLNQSGAEFTPKSIVFDQQAYMILNIDLKNITFNKLNPNKRK